MNIQQFFHTIICFLFAASFVTGQISIDQVKQSAEHDHSHEAEHDHSHQDSSIHCGSCDMFLFDASEATNINDEQLHYHAIGTDDSKSPLHCAACNTHIGYFNHENGHYQVLNKNVGKSESGGFHCASCQLPLFDKQAIDNSQAADSSNTSYTYFFAPIDEDRVSVEKKNKFYNVTGSHLNCKACKGRLGAVNNNDSGGFGMRINLGQVSKRKRN